VTALGAADEQHMRRALALAENGRGQTWPNPVVGAVIVRRGRVLAEGFHQRAGGPHAEIVALDQLGGKAAGATLYVTLEPCCHTGRTGPCTQAILKAGITRVVVGCPDENPLVAGRGIKRLRRAGVTVDVGCLGEQARSQNRGFFRWVRDGRPHVLLKAAVSLDGFIAPAGPRKPGKIHWLTGPTARAAAHELRARHDAILVGAATIAADDSRLTVRLAKPLATNVTGPRGPLRVVLDGALLCPPSARLFREPGALPPVVIGAARPASVRPEIGFERRRRALLAAGAEIVLLPADRTGRIPPARVLELLAQRQVQSVLLEGGSRVHAAFIAARLVDEVAIFLAPQLLGGGIPVAAGPGLPSEAPLRLGPLRAIPLADDILVSADVVPDGQKLPAGRFMKTAMKTVMKTAMKTVMRTRKRSDPQAR
jgi:diaminohydroxyphosphoribosylaminopyrimidine deaminase/5-amino-6-(5-phosphoribosylamino)uracil reductase